MPMLKYPTHCSVANADPIQNHLYITIKQTPNIDKITSKDFGTLLNTKIIIIMFYFGPAYATDGDYFSKPNAEDIAVVIEEMMAE